MHVDDAILSFPIFTRLTPPAAQALLAASQEKALTGGETLFQQNEPAQALYIIVTGRLCIQARQPDGTQSLPDYPGPGECIGETALLNCRPYPATASAVEDSLLLCLDKPALDQLTQTYPELITALTATLLPRFQQTQANAILTNLFGPLDEALLSELQDQLIWRRLGCSQVLCRQGDPGDEMYVVAQGRLRFAVEEAGKWRDLGEIGAGECVGEFALLTESGAPESRRSATIYATRLTDVIVITRPVFENLLCRSPQVTLKLTRRIIQRELLVAQDVLPEVSAQVITVLPTRPGQNIAGFARQLADTLNAHGPTLFLDPASFDQLYGKTGAAQTPLDHPASLWLNTWLDERERQHRYAVYEAYPALKEDGHLTPWAQRCIEDADVLLLVGEGEAGPTLNPVEAALPAAQTRARLELVLLHPAGCQVPTGTATWLAHPRPADLPVRAHHHIRQGNAVDLRRLTRRLIGRPVGLALGGGGARGWAHIGVLQAIHEANLEIDWVGGASMGAIMAAGYALDWSYEHLHQLAEKFSDPKKLLDYTLPYASLTSTRRITALLQTLYGEADIEDAWRPCFSVTANLTRGEEQLHTRGVLWKAVRASMAFPGVFAPVLDDGCVLIDGGAANNVPVDRMRELCPTGTVIGVDLLTSSPTTGPYDFGPSLSGWQALWARLNPLARSVKAPNLVDIVNAIVFSNNRYRLNEVWQCADLLIRVPVEAYGLLEFDKYRQIIDLGYHAAREQLQGFKSKT